MTAPVPIRLSTRWRWWASLLIAFEANMAYASVFNRRALTVAQFALMGSNGWAAAWAVSGILAAVALATRRVAAWQAASLAAVLISMTWATCNLIDRFVHHATSTGMGIALWGWFAATSIMIATSSAQWEAK